MLIIKRKGESRNEGNKKIKYDKFSEYFLPLGTHTYVRNVCFLGKFQVLCFFATFLPYYWRCKVHHILVYCNDEICFSKKGENSNFWKLKFKSFSRLNTYYKASRLSDGNLLTEELKFSFFKFFRLVFCCCFFHQRKWFVWGYFIQYSKKGLPQLDPNAISNMILVFPSPLANSLTHWNIEPFILVKTLYELTKS